MTDKKKKHSPAVPNRSRHEASCRVCAHPQREEIEKDFTSWRSPGKIAEAYKLRDRSLVYRHARALNLVSKRARNLRGALERIIEKVDDVPVSASAIVAAITAYGRLNRQGQLIEPSEQTTWNDVFAQMTADELETYARDGELPDWFKAATGHHSSEGDEDA